MSGVVEAVGNRITKFKMGDSVYARLPEQRIGAFAEYAAVSEDALAKMQSNPYEVFSPILNDDNFKFLSDKELPDDYKPVLINY